MLGQGVRFPVMLTKLSTHVFRDGGQNGDGICKDVDACLRRHDGIGLWFLYSAPLRIFG
jgi:hypothetical protein